MCAGDSMRHARNMDWAYNHDGSPADPDHPWNKQQDINEWRCLRFADHMAACQRAWEAGSAYALKDALALCGIFRQVPPEWLINAAGVSVIEGMTPAQKRRHKEQMIDYTRWSAMTEWK